MTAIATPTLIAGQPTPPSPPVVRVVVGYPWTKDRNDRVVSPRYDKRWISIRQHVISVGESVKTSLSLRLSAPVTFVFEVARLRGTHGRMLLDNLRTRISESDILIMDIGSSDGKGFNHNVLLETGMAIAQTNGVLRDIFILRPVIPPAPSDLSGFLFTDYEVIDDEGGIKILDVHGFRAALRSAVLKKARERGMIGPRKGAYAGPEDELEDENPSAAGEGDKGGADSTSNKPARRRK